jgi:hypothetical protein
MEGVTSVKPKACTMFILLLLFFLLTTIIGLLNGDYILVRIFVRIFCPSCVGVG